MSVLFNGGRAADLMRGAGLDAIVATSAVNVAYVCGYRNRLEVETKEFMLRPGGGVGAAFTSLAAAILGARRPILAVHGLFAAGAAGLHASMYPFGRPELDFANGRRSAGALARALADGRWASPSEALAAALRDRGVDRGRIGVELAGLSATERRLLVAALPHADLRDCTPLPHPPSRENQGGDRAPSGRRTDRGTRGPGHPRRRPTGRDARRARNTLRSAPCRRRSRDRPLRVLPRGTGIAMHSNATLRDEVAYLDFGCIRRLVRSDTGLTVAFRPPGRDLTARFQTLADAVAAGAERLRAGASTSSVWSAMRIAIDGTGVVSSPQGHGIGLEAREYPLIGPSSRARIRDDCVNLPGDLELEARMVVNLEAATFLPGVASLHVERSFVVGPRGAEPLLAEPLDRLLVLKRAQRSSPRTRPNERKAS